MKFQRTSKLAPEVRGQISDYTWKATGESGTVYSINFRADRPDLGKWMLETGTEDSMQVEVFGPTQQWIRDWAETLESRKQAA